MACLGERLRINNRQSTSVKNIRDDETLFDIQYRVYTIPTNPEWDQSSVVFCAPGARFSMKSVRVRQQANSTAVSNLPAVWYSAPLFRRSYIFVPDWNIVIGV